MCIYVYVYVSICMYMYVYVCICVYVHVHVPVHAYARIGHILFCFNLSHSIAARPVFLTRYLVICYSFVMHNIVSYNHCYIPEHCFMFLCTRIFVRTCTCIRISVSHVRLVCSAIIHHLTFLCIMMCSFNI